MFNDEKYKEEMLHSKNSDLLRELNELYEEELIKNYKIISIEINKIKFSITTIEDKFLHVSTDLNDCYKVENDDDNLYENFEQLLNRHSQAYSSRFAKLLFDKLSNLQHA